MRRTLASVAVLATLASGQALAHRPVALTQWDRETHLWLARAMVAEAGFKSGRDHVALAYVLARRFQRARERWPELRFMHVIRRYCAGLGGRQLTSRQRWVRELGHEARKPQGWPARISWASHRPLWETVLRRARRWSRGELDDPCGGRAWHWGGTIDTPRGRMVEVDCGDTLNTFYELARQPLRYSVR